MQNRRPGPGMPGLPPGVTPEMMQKMMTRMPQSGMPGQSPQAQTPGKERFNPLPDDTKGTVKILKAHSGCQMPREAATLNALMTKAQEVSTASTKETELDAALAEAITQVFRSDRECEKQLTARTAGLFDEDAELHLLSDKIDALFKELHELEETIKKKAEEFNTLSQQRWEKAIKAFGLNIQERFYKIDTVGRKIQQIDMKCEACQGIKLLKDARQKLAHILIAIDTEAAGKTVEPLKEEKTDGREETAGRSDNPGSDGGTPGETQGKDVGRP